MTCESQFIYTVNHISPSQKNLVKEVCLSYKWVNEQTVLFIYLLLQTVCCCYSKQHLWEGWMQKTPSLEDLKAAWLVYVVDFHPAKAFRANVKVNERVGAAFTIQDRHIKQNDACDILKNIYHSAASGTEKNPACIAACIWSSVKPISVRVLMNPPMV